ncbi:MAG: FAD-dependent oxidoreductase [Acidimicrobiales bacterium]
MTTQSTIKDDIHGPATVDLQIIGGGLAGLVAANLAIDAGLSVRLIESQRSLGGRAGSTEYQRFVLNQGPHALYVDGALNKTLRSLGIKPRGSAPVIKGATGSIGSVTGLLPGGPASLLRTNLLPARGKWQLAKLMAGLQRIDPQPLGSTSVEQWIDSITDVPELKAMLTGLVSLSTYSFTPVIASADTAVEQLQMALGNGVLYLDGGWVDIVSELENRAERLGSFERVTAKVLEVTAGHDGGHSCRTADTNYSAANVLLAAGSPALVDRLLGDSSASEMAGPPVQAAVLDLGLKTEPPVGIHLGLDVGLYLSKHSSATSLTPAGHSLVSVARYLRPDDKLGPDETKSLLLAHARAAGINPADIVMDRYLHRLTVAFGRPLAKNGGLAGRPPVTVAGRPGIYVAGDWVGGTGLLADASAASAAEAVTAIVATAPKANTRLVPAAIHGAQR